MAKTAHRSINHVKGSTMSSGSGQMAKPCSHEVSSIDQEREELLAEKKELETKLSRYSKTALLKEQMRIRRGKGNTLEQWIKRKGQLEDERQTLITEKTAVETRMMHIKDRVKQVRRIQNAADDPHYIVFTEILDELRAIRELLEENQRVED